MQYPDGMSEAEAASSRAAIEALRALETDAPELERLEGLLDRFNVFETIGFVGQELMHSRFLAFLLDPKQNHGLGDLFLSSFLRKVSESNDEVVTPKAPISAEDRNLDRTAVETEVHTGDGRIDILLSNEAGEWAMIIENKVWTVEHSDQLDKYFRFVQQHRPGWRVFGVYLTPLGDVPSHEAYLPVSYGAVCRVSEDVIEVRASVPNPDVRMAVGHYAEMVRRNIVGDAEVSKLSLEIYRKHHRAIHRILEELEATSEAVHRLARSLIRETPQLTYGYRESEVLKDWIVFDHREWDVPALKVGERYRNSDRLLYFVLYSDFSECLEVWLELGPGDTATRDKLLGMARKNPSTFVAEPDKTQRWTSLFKRTLLTKEPLERLSGEEREREVRRQWAAFLQEDLPRIEAALDGEAWIWSSTGAGEGR